MFLLANFPKDGKRKDGWIEEREEKKLQAGGEVEIKYTRYHYFD